MIDYSIIPNTVGSFPNVVGQNASGGAAVDGTPYLKSVIDDLWGANQALMDAAGLSPNATSEAVGASQRLEALRAVCGAPGELVLWTGFSDPASTANRIIPLEGQGVEVVNYPALVAACYVGDANNANVSVQGYYKATTAAGTTRSVSGDWFILPDYRGYFLRGRDLADLRDPSGSTRGFYGTVENDSQGRHTHGLQSRDTPGGDWDRMIQTGEYWLHNTDPGSASLRHVAIGYEFATFEPTRAAPDLAQPNEVRPVNQTANICVRY